MATPASPSVFSDEARHGPFDNYSGADHTKAFDSIAGLREENAKLQMELDDCLDLLDRKNTGLQQVKTLRQQIEAEKVNLQRHRIMSKGEKQLAVLVTSICYQNVHKAASRYDGGCDQFLRGKESEHERLQKTIHGLEELAQLQHAQFQNQQTKRIEPRAVPMPTQRPGGPLLLPSPLQLTDVYNTFLGASRQSELLKRI